MTLEELARLVKKTRDKQAEFFKTRRNDVLAECRDWERRLDAAVEAILSPPEPELFPPKEEP